MAAKKTKAEGTHLSDAGTSSKYARIKAEAERQATARTVRDELAAETEKAFKATAKRLENKPTDTRNVGG